MSSFPSEFNDPAQHDHLRERRRDPDLAPFLPQRSIDFPGEREARRLLAEMPYGEYLETVHWRWRRRRAYWLADNRCQRCGGHQRLQVHHLSYERRGWEEDGDLVVLCDGCHAQQHGLRFLQPPLR